MSLNEINVNTLKDAVVNGDNMTFYQMWWQELFIICHLQ